MQAKLNEIRALISKYGGESKSKAVCVVACALILHYFVIEHIPASGVNLISVLSPIMLKRDAMHSRRP